MRSKKIKRNTGYVQERRANNKLCRVNGIIHSLPCSLHEDGMV